MTTIRSNSYPPGLKELAVHAERFCALLGRQAARARASEAADLWLRGREGEVALVFELQRADVEAGLTSEQAAARSLAQYLDDLHAGASSALSLSPPLECCEDEVFLTVCQADAPTVRAGAAASVRMDDTWFDPRTVAEGELGDPLAGARVVRAGGGL